MPREAKKPTPVSEGIPFRDRELLTFGLASQVLGISIGSLEKAVKEEQLVVVQAPGTFSSKGRRILRASIDQYLAEAYKESKPSLKSSD